MTYELTARDRDNIVVERLTTEDEIEARRTAKFWVRTSAYRIIELFKDGARVSRVSKDGR